MLLDLTAAFDTVDHDILIDVLLRRFGVEGRARQRFASKLADRAAYVSNLILRGPK